MHSKLHGQHTNLSKWFIRRTLWRYDTWYELSAVAQRKSKCSS